MYGIILLRTDEHSLPARHNSTGGECAVTHVTPRTKENRKRRLLLPLTLLLLMLVTAAALLPRMASGATAAAPIPHKARIVQYVQDSSSFPISDENAAHVDQLNYAFALLQDGRADVSHMHGLDEVKRFLRRHPHIDGVLSVGGWGADGFSEACATAAGRQLLCNSILSLMDAHGFVGVDIDWEYPGMTAGGVASSDDDVENWYALLALLRQGLDERERANGREYVLSVALGAGEDHMTAVDGARLNELVDQAVVMAYDLRGFDRMTGHHAGLYPDGETMLSGAWAVQSWLSSGLDPDRILLGIPQYGRMWRSVASETDGLHARAETSGNKVILQDEIPSLIESGYTRRFDEHAKAPYLFNGMNFVSYDDEESVRAKAEYILEHDLLGAALWAAGHDTGSVLPAALSEAFALSEPSPAPEEPAETPALNGEQNFSQVVDNPA